MLCLICDEYNDCYTCVFYFACKILPALEIKKYFKNSGLMGGGQLPAQTGQKMACFVIQVRIIFY